MSTPSGVAASPEDSSFSPLSLSREPSRLPHPHVPRDCRLFEAGEACAEKTDVDSVRQPGAGLDRLTSGLAEFQLFAARHAAKVIVLVREGTFGMGLSTYKSECAQRERPCGELAYYRKTAAVEACLASWRINASVPALEKIWRGIARRSWELRGIAAALSSGVGAYVLSYETVVARQDLPSSLWAFLGAPPVATRSAVKRTSASAPPCWRQWFVNPDEVSASWQSITQQGQTGPADGPTDGSWEDFGGAHISYESSRVMFECLAST